MPYIRIVLVWWSDVEGGEEFYKFYEWSQPWRRPVSLNVTFSSFSRSTAFLPFELQSLEGVGGRPFLSWDKALGKSFALKGKALLWGTLWVYFTRIPLPLPLPELCGDFSHYEILMEFLEVINMIFLCYPFDEVEGGQLKRHKNPIWGEWWICSLSWWWWWFHRYVHISKLIRLYTLFCAVYCMPIIPQQIR